MEKEESMRKGPWTEQEDVQLALYVNLFGDRRWDFIAKVSGLKRTGKSCRLRWVNYLHPGLKRGKMTPHEERLVLQLHSKWGNRWSKIARKLPGRTDNEIKNYWRSHMRKLAQQRKKGPPTACSFSPSSSLSSSNPENEFSPMMDHMKGLSSAPLGERHETGVKEQNCNAYSMDHLWKEFEFSQEIMTSQTVVVQSPAWESCPLWSMDEPSMGSCFPDYYYI